MESLSDLQPITLTGSSSLGGIGTLPVTPAAAFLGAADALLQGVRVLASVDPVPAVALTFLGGQILESCLKAYLAVAGVDETELSKRPYGHDLQHLWSAAAKAGLDVGQDPPDWVQQLVGLHSYPFFLRYPMGLNGLVLPNSALLATELDALASKIRPLVR